MNTSKTRHDGGAYRRMKTMTASYAKAGKDRSSAGAAGARGSSWLSTSAARCAAEEESRQGLGWWMLMWLAKRTRRMGSPLSAPAAGRLEFCTGPPT